MRAMTNVERQAGTRRRDRMAGMARRPAFWFGLILILLGASAALLLPIGPGEAARGFALLLLGAGLIELASGALDHRAGRAAGLMDGVIGAVSIGFGTLLLLRGLESATSVHAIIFLWMVSRGVLDVAGAALMPGPLLQDVRIVRGGIDLLLGVVGWVALAIVPWWELLFGWPTDSLHALRLFAAASIVTTGLYLMSESRTRSA
jgi:hypothetical protein